MKLGVILAEAARAGRDKVTFVASQEIETFADWAEQLIAESTGKEGKGLVPVAGEALGGPASYGNDRLFVYLKLQSDGDHGTESREIESKLRALESAGHPVIRIELPRALDLGQEFFRWEVATATVGSLLGINAFDQPNVQESKDNTNRLLAQFRAQGKLPGEAPAAQSDGIELFARDGRGATVEQSLASFLGQADGLRRPQRAERRPARAHPPAPARRSATGYHPGLWPQVPALDGTAPQGGRG
ncbi:MAG: hypothetical protein DMG24_14160 [Acidobacteria bacterium]|nr:MAG: hypothetical protein DMG24_14160 [Acidobacteriota bacterium]